MIRMRSPVGFSISTVISVVTVMESRLNEGDGTGVVCTGFEIGVVKMQMSRDLVHGVGISERDGCLPQGRGIGSRRLLPCRDH